MFIMLLAFFIVLNALSSYEENKADPILGSLQNTFSSATSNIAQRLPSVRPSESEEEFKGEGQTTTVDRIKDLFRGRIAQIEIKENKERGIMMVEVPYAEFSTAILAMGQNLDDIGESEEMPFLPTLVSLLQTENNGQRYRIDMILKTTADPIDLKSLQPEAFRSARDKIGKLSRRLGTAGIPDHFMSIGLRQGRENMLDLIFKPYEELSELPPAQPEQGGAANE